MPGSVAPLDMTGVQIPYHFRCPISLELMRDPVTVCTGQTYDRPSIESWVATGHTTCPVTRAPLADFTLIPNHTLRRLIQEWCVAHRSLGVERIPTPKQPADPTLLRLLISQAAAPRSSSAARLAAVRRLRALAKESDKNRALMATRETREAMVGIALADADPDLAAEAMAVLAMIGMGEAEAADLAERPDRICRLGTAVSTWQTLEARISAGAVIEAAAAVGARTAVGAADGVVDGVVRLIAEKGNARAARVGIRALFALCLAKENRHLAVAAGAAAAVVERVREGTGESERAMATVELLCRSEEGREAVMAAAAGDAGGAAAVVAALVRGMAGKAAEHAAGALVAMVGASETLQKEAVKAGAMNQLLLMVQGGCSDRAKRKAQLLLKILRSAWPQHDDIINSVDFLRPF
ncbi:U-box domain-containing protein 26-like [Typha angustifolia]|uniref:U-box domain-containing protein 26-like n=1 Tax=Typha angustifolia TaxID=59011 RepID=UPI003C2C016F